MNEDIEEIPEEVISISRKRASGLMDLYKISGFMGCCFFRKSDLLDLLSIAYIQGLRDIREVLNDGGN